MIGVFDSGLGGLTVLRALVARFPHLPFIYLGDHANVPYGDRSSPEVIELTRQGVEALFGRGIVTVVEVEGVQGRFEVLESRGEYVLSIPCP